MLQILCEDLITTAADFVTGPDRGAKFEQLYLKMRQINLDAVRKELDLNHYLAFPYDWRFLDPVYTRIQNFLDANVLWPYGLNKTSEQLQLFELGMKHVCIKDSEILEFGSGVFSPHVLSSYFYINGAKTCCAVDSAVIDNHENAARTLRKFLIEALTHPDKWCRGEISREEFISRISHFDFDYLEDSEIDKALARVPIRYVNGSLGNLPVDLKLDFLFSCTALEHVFDLPDVFNAFSRLLKPDGIMCHVVDFTDHAYHAGRCPHRWGYLTEHGEEDPGVNGVRLSEMVRQLESQGFETLEISRSVESPPEDVIANLRPQYKALSKDDLETYLATIVSRRKPSLSHDDAVKREEDAGLAEGGGLAAPSREQSRWRRLARRLQW